MTPEFLLSYEPIYIISIIAPSINKFEKKHKRRYTTMYNKKNMTRLLNVKKLYY
ncbi:ORF-47 [Buzura suppressaria nucleopolyhedrovirus]|uniref:ORF-47 n=1 Tax=Buzura suppressaria nuclear polyhedrosis virus TaxID=74320 RepID=W5VKF5_NPVBS|nr:ORF-47 [Buzura suppressaria nucleopolyhedrovirus]AHH82636.1 ORF-47 [Buzura suppressaria nucleopolyhedrovirus]AKN91019.1 ORF-49 [Buzura suppressaria nucleopolyhedrovirus]QYF10613.1 hypothetical protein [Buzura suppressaria nucleopolyhedrovirus]